MSGSSDNLPYVFLGKKLGYMRETQANSLAVRVNFVYELDCEKSSSRLIWNKIAGNGSSRLRTYLRQYEGEAREDDWLDILTLERFARERSHGRYGGCPGCPIIVRVGSGRPMCGGTMPEFGPPARSCRHATGARTDGRHSSFTLQLF